MRPRSSANNQPSLEHGATQELGILQGGKRNTVDELRQKIRGFHGVLQVRIHGPDARITDADAGLEIVFSR